MAELNTPRERADQAQAAVLAYHAAQGDEEFHLADLIGDLGHWHETYGPELDSSELTTFRDVLRAAYQHYLAETGQDRVDETIEAAASMRLHDLAEDPHETEALLALVTGAQAALEHGSADECHQALFHLVQALGLPEDGDGPDDDTVELPDGGGDVFAEDGDDAELAAG
jgi:hypothetical protein